MKIRDYLSSVRELQAQFNRINSNSDQKETRTDRVNADAVRVASVLREQPLDFDRRARISELKSAVREGAYKPNSEEVARAVIRDLFGSLE